jgi:hypothetical protein
MVVVITDATYFEGKELYIFPREFHVVLLTNSDSCLALPFTELIL